MSIELPSWKNNLSGQKFLDITYNFLTGEDCVSIASLLSSTTCLTEFSLIIKRPTESIDNIIKALATNQLLLLGNLNLQVNEIHETHIDFLITFVRNLTTLKRLLIVSALTANAEKLLELLKAIDHHPTLQEKLLSQLKCRITADSDVNALNHLCCSYWDSMRNDYTFNGMHSVREGFIKYIG